MDGSRPRQRRTLKPCRQIGQTVRCLVILARMLGRQTTMHLGGNAMSAACPPLSSALLRCAAPRAGRGAELSDPADPGDRHHGPGGISDVFVRALGALHKRLGQPVVVENRRRRRYDHRRARLRRAPPDGYTFCVMPGEPLTYNLYHSRKACPSIRRRASTPITNFFFITQALASAPSSA